MRIEIVSSKKISLLGVQIDILNFNFFVAYNLFANFKQIREFNVKLTETDFINSEETEINLLNQVYMSV